MTDHERAFVLPFTRRARTIGVGVDEGADHADANGASSVVSDVEVPATAFWELDDSLPTGKRLPVDPGREGQLERPRGRRATGRRDPAPS